MENEMGEAREVEVAGKKLRIHESRNTCDPATGRALTGSWLWDSALHLSQWMAADTAAPQLAGKTVLELGAGTGLPGLTAALLGAARVVLTDQAPLLPGLRVNAAANGLADSVEVRELTWGAGGEDPGGEPPDVVLMSDVFYDPDEMAGLAGTLSRVCGEATVIWSASEVRESVNRCLELLAEEGFRVADLPAVRRQLLRSPGESSEFAIFVIEPPRKGALPPVRQNPAETIDEPT